MTSSPAPRAPRGPGRPGPAASGQRAARATVPDAAPAVGPDRTVGRCEWLALPDFGIACIQARLDARGGESKLSAVDVALSGAGEDRRARFLIRPIPGDEQTAVVAEAPLVVRSGDDPDDRPIVRTHVTLGEETWPVDLRLVPHDPWRFRLYLGSAALGQRVVVDPNTSFLAGPPSTG